MNVPAHFTEEEPQLSPTKTVITLAFASLSVPAWSQDAADPGKAMVEGTCNSCHPLSARVGTGYTPEGWKTVMQMMKNHGAQIPADKEPAMMSYLVKTYPVKGRPDAVVVQGPVKVSMQAWQVGQPASRPHDPLAAKDGSYWYTGQMTNVLGRIDPKTGKVKEYPLKTPHSGPHGLVEDRSGNIWYTGNAGSTVGKVNPKTGEVTEYKMPDAQAKDPHTPIFDKKGVFWFSVQGGNKIGRLDPKEGKVKLIDMPTPKSRPYGMAVDSKNNVWSVLFGVNKVAVIDQKTLKVKEYDLPNKDSRPRRIAITPDDMVWYTDYSRGYLGRLNPKTGEVKEWQSPSGAKSAPYGISNIKGVLWYSESEASPNTIVRFDPKTEKFQSWTIPGGGNIVRNTDVTKDGNFLLANSLTNEVTVVRIGK